MPSFKTPADIFTSLESILWAFMQLLIPSPPWTNFRTPFKGGKNSSPGTIMVYKNPPPTQNRETKAPPQGQKVRKFYKCIYELSPTLWHYLKWKALWSQQIKRFYNEETLYYYSICYLAKTLAPGQSWCTKTLPQHKTGRQKPHRRDKKLENFTNVSMNCLPLSDTIWNEKLCGLNK